MATLGVTTMSAESKTEPGGYFTYPQALEQFHVSDERKAVEVDAALRSLGRIPVYKDWDGADATPMLLITEIKGNLWKDTADKPCFRK